MTIPQLSQEEIKTWTLEQKDRWWLEHVYRGDMPQLTWRSAISGFLLGGLLSATNLYVGAKTGWSLGVGVTSVILAFAFFRVLHQLGMASEFTILENNCTQSIATAAGYMTMPLTSSMVAYMIADNRLLPWHQLVIWNVLVSILGVLFAFPLKRRFINDEQFPFPEGRAAAVVMDSLHQSEVAAKGLGGAGAMLGAAGLAGLTKFFQAEGIQTFLQQRVLGRVGEAWRLPERLDFLLLRDGKSPWSIRGIPWDKLTIIPSLELALIGAGGLLGIRGAVSLMLGAVLNYFVLAPWMIGAGEIKPIPGTEADPMFGLKQISSWSLWPGVACMVIASFVAFFAKPRALWESLCRPFRRGQNAQSDRGDSDILQHIELPNRVSLIGIPVVSLVAAWTAKQFFGVDMLTCLIGLPLTFVLTLVAANSTALTSITPVGATSKVTQLFYGVVDRVKFGATPHPSSLRTNLAMASLTAEVVSNASNLLMDIKPGYMLGAKPRQQAIGHLIGIWAGSIFSVPLFFLLFTQDVSYDAQAGTYDNVASIKNEEFPMPSATVWLAVAEAVTHGLDELPRTVRPAILIGALVGGALELIRLLTAGRVWLSPMCLGLAFVIDFGSSFAMFLGAFLCWLLGVEKPLAEGQQPSFWKANHESICAGVIAGASLLGILDAVVSVFFLG